MSEPSSATIIIGHRGSGKSSFLRRVAGYLAEWRGAPLRFRDLDEEIDRRAGKPVSRIFEDEGEKRFREREAELFTRLISEARAAGEHLFLSVGGGFQAEVPPEVRRLWLRRCSDPGGRIFLDRPRLNSRVSALEEFQERYEERERRYRELATEVWTMSEGFDFPNPMEEAFTWNALVPEARQAREIQLKGRPALTLLPGNFTGSGGGFPEWIARRLLWRDCRFEIRDDLLGFDQRENAWSIIPAERIIYSFREAVPSASELQAVLARGCAWDWPLELGPVPLEGRARPTILSLHERIEGESVTSAAARLEAAAERLGPGEPIVLKLAVMTGSFQELREGHLWAAREPGHRAFLPRSPRDRPGRWAWYRAWTLGGTPLGFTREAEGSSPDQPALMEWLRIGATHRGAGPFAAVLGDPVANSRTPAEQAVFFEGRGIPVFGVAVSESEWDQGALEILGELGLRYAAVTSPLKQRAYAACDPRTREDLGLGAINTLYRDARGSWRGRNTDLAGLEAILPGDAADVAVWGGGGTLEAIRRVTPGAVFHSARTGQPRDGSSVGRAPRTVVWAVGRSRLSGLDGGGWPPVEWKPETVIDLNYSEDSPGREFALKTGARYVSGLAMFRAQAAAQRSYWEEREKNDFS